MILKEKTENNNFYFIAEIGQNHQGKIDIAKKMVDEIKTIGGVSAIKTAKRNLDVCLTEEMKRMPYINQNSFGKTYYEHRKKLELSDENFSELKNYIEKNGFDFISSFTDIPSLHFLIDLGVKILKIASQRATDIELLKETAKTKSAIILSTGMCNLSNVDKAVDVLKDNELYVLQSTSSYPCSDYDLNLNIISLYKDRYSGIIDGVGFSGHHTGIAPDIAAYMLGARIFERHFTLDRAMKGTDHAASLEGRGLELVTKYLNQVKISIGSSEKRILPCEVDSIRKLRCDFM
ncbi:MAG: N-acetylneuraminate synthase family protein [Bacteroidales bacterium]|jgi:sialic acid synthase SpsE